MADPRAEFPDAFLEALCTTRAIRRFKDEDVAEEDLHKMFFAATRAPSGSNRQNFRFVVLRRGSPTARARRVLAEEYRRRWNSKAETEGFRGRVRDNPDSRMGRMVDSMDKFVDDFEDIPVIVLVCILRHEDPTPLEGSSIYPACQNLLLAARVLGYGGVLTQFHTGVGQQLASMLDMPDAAEIVGVIALGRPVGRHGPVRRMPMKECVFEDQWGTSAPWLAEDL